MSSKRTRFWVNKLSRRVAQLASSSLYVNPEKDFNKSIMIAGTGRSGSTWLGDLIASQVRCRVMFEPFNPALVREYRDFNYFQYMRPGDENPALHEFSRRILSGEIRNRWIDHKNEQFFPQYRIIKEIRANLLLKWMHDHFPEVPIIFIMRHPCAVVLSRMELGWATDTDIEPFLAQPTLVSDHLAEHLDLIRHAKTQEEKHAIIWCISNMVPLRQFEPGTLRTVYYEDLCTQPEVEVPAIFESMRIRYEGDFTGKVNRPSQTTRETSAVVIGSDRVASWQKKLESSQIENILRIVRSFGLDHIYGDSLVPLDHHAV